MSTSSVQNSPPPLTYPSPPLPIIVTFIILIFFFLALFIIFFCRCFMQNVLYSWRISIAGIPIGPTKNVQGLDPLIIQSFPTFIYSSVQDYGKGKFELECAICLVEFVDTSLVRLLTSCNHVFHQECIDRWLESHKTCPVCRANLASLQRVAKCSKVPLRVGSRKSNHIGSTNNAMHGVNNEDELLENTCYITIDNDDDDNNNNNENDNTDDEKGCSSGRAEKIMAPIVVERVGLQERVKNFSRSNSTGHSIIRIRENEDRFTLKLPEHVKTRIIKGHNTTRSCTTFGEFKSKTTTGNYGSLGEVSGLSSVYVDRV